jgi:ABC-type nitrate/sulfonate/bicarbonate transport system substrate-binding protein
MKRVYSDCNLKCKAVVGKWFRWKFALCIWIILVFSGPVEGQDLKKIRVAIPALSMTSFSTLIPREKGYWRDEGLDVEVVVVRAAASVLALEAREVDFITVGGGGLLGILRGLPLRVVFTPFRRPTYAIYAWPEIRSMQELKGKKVGVSSIGSGPDSLLRDLLKKKMADGGLNVTILAVGGGAERFAALQTRTVDAAILSNPSTLMAKQAGFRELYSFMKEKDYTDVTTATVYGIARQ